MPDRHASAEPVFLGQLADQMNIHLVRRISRIEMHVDVRIELAGQVEHPADLADMVRIVVTRRASVPPPATRPRGGCWSAPPAGTRTTRDRSPRRNRAAVPR